jgi:DNA primase
MSAFEEIKLAIRQVPISQVVSLFIPIEKKGQNYEGICPFHPDHKPSLKINDQKNLFKCFVCEKVGDAITFAMEFKKWDFVTALKELGTMLHIDVSQLSKNSKQDLELLPYYQFIERVLALYQEYTKEYSPVEWETFLKERHLTPDIVNEFELCFAPRNNLLVQNLNQVAGDERQRLFRLAEELALIKITDQGPRDTFRNRILFPIRNHSGRLVGLSSRAVHPDQVPKYLNSSESKIFNKRQVLFGFHKAKPFIRENPRLILTEGHMDTITMHKFGFKQSVATMGTAFSVKLVQLLASLKCSIYLCMDQDQAGIMAMDRMGPIFLAQHLLVKRVDLSGAKDPDEFLNRFGAMEMEQRLQNAKIWLDEKLESITSVPTGANRELKLKKLQEVFNILAPLGMSLEATERAVEQAIKLGLQSASSAILDSYQDFLRGRPTPIQKLDKESESKAGQEAVIPPLPATAVTNEPKSTLELWPTDATFLLKQIFTYPELLGTNHFAEILKLVYNEPFRTFLSQLKLIYVESSHGQELFHQSVLDALALKDDLREWHKQISDIMFTVRPQKLEDKGIQKVATDLLMRWKLMVWQDEIAQLQKQRLVTLEKDELDAIYKKMFDLKKSVNELNNAMKKSPLRLSTNETNQVSTDQQARE